MEIEKLKDNNIENIEVGDLLESEFTGNMYLITESAGGKFGWVNLKNNKICSDLYDTITDLVYETIDNYVIHKGNNLKLTIQ